MSQSAELPIRGNAIWGRQFLEVAAARVNGRWLIWLQFSGIVALSLSMNTWGLSMAGYGNTYYAAAVRSMTASWSNFFFGAFDPGGFITVDKPPAFLWVGALSAHIFGYSNWSILLPSAIAGAASVGLLWLIVRRYFGPMAATIAGLALALSPISVAVNRLNLPEPFLILALIGAAGAILHSLESRRWWAWLCLAGLMVGVAFNTKMLAAWIPGPAFALALVVGMSQISKASLRQTVGQLAVLGVVTLVVSASWMLVVDLWPKSDRPYIGGSANNTVLDLALGYNGFGRVDGEDQTGGGGPRPAPNAGSPGGQGAPANFRGPGGIFDGFPSVLRMFDDANGGQIGWLLPFALGGGLLALWQWRRDPVRRAFAALFLGWIVLYGGVFSYAQGIYHSYYTSAMAPGVAALVGMGTVAIGNGMRCDRRWLIVLLALVGLTVWTQLQIAGRTPDFYGWVRPLTLAMALAGIAAVIFLTFRRLPLASGLAVSVAGLLLLPAAWSLSASTNSSLNATLPQAGPRQGASGRTFGSQAFDDGTAGLAAWLKSHEDADATWQLVVTNAQNASRLIAQYDVSTMALGGFLGRDNTISVSGFADLVASGEVRYVLVGQGMGPGRGPARTGPPGRGPGPGAPQGAGPVVAGGAPTSGPNAVMSAVQNSCAPVSDPSLPSQYRASLYDCAGKAEAIRAWV